MFVLGLTGSIGMGKSTAAAMLRRLGLPVHDADGAVHRLLARGGAAVAPVAAAFPDSLVDGAIDRQRLGARVFGDAAALRRLESILHPLVRRATVAFLARHARYGTPMVVLEIPLLFETGGERLCDAVVLVTASPAVQRARVLSRPGMTARKFAGIIAEQMPDAEKRRRADFVIETGLGKRDTLRRLIDAVAACRARPGRVWSPALQRRSANRNRHTYA